MAKNIKTWNYGGWVLGYNNYSGSKSQIKKTEFAPPSRNVDVTGVGSIKKSAGALRFGDEVNAGYSVLNGVQFKTSALDVIIIHSGTKTFYMSSNYWVAMTGLTLNSTRPAFFCRALDRLYCSQEGLGKLYVTTDGKAWAEVTSGRELVSMVFFNQRLYGIDPSTGYIWYSNPFGVVTSPPSINLADFATFDTNLGSSPKKNAGFMQFAPGSGVKPTSLFYDSSGTSEAIYSYTEGSGYWKISPVSALNADGSVAHQIYQANGYFGSPAPLSVIKVGNDQWFFDGEMLNSNGEVALYQNIRVTPKFGKLKKDLQSMPASGISLPALGFINNIVYFAYPTGAYNNKVVAYDTILGAPGAPKDGFNCAFFLTYTQNGKKRLLYGSSDPSDSYMYEMGVGIDVSNTPVDFLFVPQSTNCDYPGRVKRLVKAKIFYTTVFGVLNFRVIFEETRDLLGSRQIGTSATRSSGLGCQSLGSYPLGRDYILGSTLTKLATNSYFEIEGEFEAFERISIELSNSSSGEQVQIDDISYDIVVGNVFETLED